MNPVYIFASYVFALAGQLGDCYTTEVGLNGGLKEGNGIAKWFTDKIGHAGLSALKCVGLAQFVPVMAYLVTNDQRIFVGTASFFGAIGMVATVSNYLLIKKSGIKF